jgi:succinyl-diaminopimelate desuccinylase
LTEPLRGPAKSLTVDEDYVWSLFERFVAADTAVLPNRTAVDPLDPRVGRFASDVVAPELARLGATVEVDGLNSVVGRFGPLQGSEVAVVSYPITHHANQMTDALHARKSPLGIGETAWLGLGASQGKAAMAAVLGAASALLDQGEDFSGRVVLAISSEGSSSHRSAESLYRSLKPLPSAVVLAIGTENQLMLGNRGRVDIYIDVRGQATHSSVPHRGNNPILRLSEVFARLSSLSLDPTPHPQLGPRAQVPYSLVCGPIAPHTIPAECRITVDRRLLQGTLQKKQLQMSPA